MLTEVTYQHVTWVANDPKGDKVVNILKGLARRVGCIGSVNIDEDAGSRSARAGKAPERRAVGQTPALHPDAPVAAGYAMPRSASVHANRAAKVVHGMSEQEPLIRQDLIPGIQIKEGDTERLCREPNDPIEIPPATPGADPVKVYSFGAPPPDLAISFDTSRHSPQYAQPQGQFVATGSLLQCRADERLVSDEFSPCVPVIAVYPGKERSILHLAKSTSKDRIDQLMNTKVKTVFNPDKVEPWYTTKNPTDVYVVTREAAGNYTWNQSRAVAHAVNHAPKGTNVHVVSVPRGGLAVQVGPQGIDIWDLQRRYPS